PSASAEFFIFRGGRSRGIDVFLIVLDPVPGVGPFDNVAEHVIKAEGVGLLFADGMGCKTGVVPIPGDIVDLSITASCGSAACAVFPFGFGGKAAADGPAVDIGLVPTD